MKVMFIDDEQAYLKYCAIACRDAGYEVVQVGNPDEALEILISKQEQPDIIILDIMMPSLRYKNSPDYNDGLNTGVLLYQDIREHCPNIPIIILTNVGNPERINEIEKKTICEVYQKNDIPPFKLAEIIEKKVGEVK